MSQKDGGGLYVDGIKVSGQPDKEEVKKPVKQEDKGEKK